MEREIRYAHTGKYEPAAAGESVGSESPTFATLGDFILSLDKTGREKFRSAQEILPGLWLGPQTAAFWTWRKTFSHYLSMNGARCALAPMQSFLFRLAPSVGLPWRPAIALTLRRPPSHTASSGGHVRVIEPLDDAPEFGFALAACLETCVNWISTALEDKSSSSTSSSAPQVLVYCTAGRSRSVAVVCAYIMAKVASRSDSSPCRAPKLI